jgi:uncharacterized membrane protein YphA (DoxX/SURF4 family)
MKTMDWLYRLCRWTLGCIFIYAGGTKLLEPEIFAVLIEAYGYQNRCHDDAAASDCLPKNLKKASPKL